MNGRLAFASFLGGAAVYFAFAACGQSGMPRAGNAGGGGSIIVDASPVPDAHAQEAASGTRLKARYLVTDDGARSFVGWYDSARGENCDFMLAPDGVTRCMPFIPKQASKVFSGAFADPACTQRVEQRAANPQTCQPAAPMFVYESIGTLCQPAFRFYEFGDPYNGPIYSMVNGLCTLNGPTPNEYYVGAEVPASTWQQYAAAHEQHD